MQAKSGPINAQAIGMGIHLEQYATLHIQSNPVIQYPAMRPLSQATLTPQSLASSLRSLYLSQKNLSIFRIKAEQEWEFKVPLEEIYVRLGIIESKERIARDQALDKHSEHIQDERIPTSETIYGPKKNIEIEKLFEHESLEKKAAKRIYIQGAAGIGKSTLCHYIAYHWAKEELWQGIFSYLFWIPLRNLTLRKYPANKKCTPAKLIAREYAGKINSRVIEACVNDNTFREKTLLVLDGYDELSADAQGNTSLATAFKDLKELFPHILITSRPGSCSFNRSCDLELLGFDKEGVDRYIDRFFKQVQAEEKRQKLYHLLQTSPHVFSLAQIPINLTLLCCLFNEDPEVFDSTQSITMTAIYERIVNWMYKWFLLRRIDQGQSSQTKETILAEKNLRHNQEVAKIATAFEKMADFAMENNTLYLRKQEIDDFRGDAITSKELADCGLLRIPEEKGYFIHLTFQEFLTASKVANQYLQGGSRQACQDFVRNYKFEPRYNLVLRMIAGYLSLSTSRNRRYLDSNPLQSFFDDLFAEPHDLAVRSELNLIANCFEECQNPAQVRQYEGFIDLVKDYMIDLSLLDLDFEQLIRNKNLFNHPKIMHTIDRLLSDPKAIGNTLANLEDLMRTGQRFPLEIVRFIAKVLKRPNGISGDNQSAATRVLRVVAKQGAEFAKEVPISCQNGYTQIIKEDYRDAKASTYVSQVMAQHGGEFPKEALDALIQLLKKHDYNSYDKNYAIEALRAVAEQGGKLSKEAVDALSHVLKEVKGFFNAKRYAVDALGAVVKQGGELLKEALDGLIHVLGDPDAKYYAINALKTVVKQGGELLKEVLDALIQILMEGNSDAKRAAAKALAEVVKEGCKLPKEALDALIHVLKEGNYNAADVLEEVAKQGGELSKEALDGLIHVLGDPHTSLSVVYSLTMVAEQGGKLSKEAVDALIHVLKEGDSAAKEDAMCVLGFIAQHRKLPKEALDALIHVLKEGDSADKELAAAVLTILPERGGELPKEVLDAFVLCLKEGYPGINDHAVTVLKIVAQQGDEIPKEALDALVVGLKEGDSWTKADAASALTAVVQQGGELPREALDSLIQILKKGHSCVTDKEREAQREALRAAASSLTAVVRQGGELSKEALDALIQLLKEGNSDVKAAAAKALGEVVKEGGKLPKEKEVVDALVVGLKEGNSWTKAGAATALTAVVRQGGELSKEALDALIQILKEGYSCVADEEREALRAAASALTAAASALRAFAQQGGELTREALDALVQILKEGHSCVTDREREALRAAASALRAFAQQGGELPKKALDALIQILMEGNSDVKAAAANALGEVVKEGGKLPKEALDALIQILKKGYSCVAYKGHSCVTYEERDALGAAASALTAVVRQGGELSKEALDALIQILRECNYLTHSPKHNHLKEVPSILLAVVQQRGKLAKEALDALIQILMEGNSDAKRLAASKLKNSDKNALLEMSTKAFPLIAKVCFFIEDSLSFKGQQLQISDKKTTYFCKDKLMLHYEEIRKQLPKELAVWRKRLDSLSLTESF